MGWFRSNRAQWAVRLALLALFLRALTPTGPAAAMSGGHGDEARAFAICASFLAKQTPDDKSAPARRGDLHDCVMCLASPGGAAVVLATLAADVLAPDQLLQTVEASSQEDASSEFSPRTKPARAPPARPTA